MDRKYSKACCEEVLKWYGWGSPIGLTVFILGVGIFALLIRLVVVGF